MKDWEGGYGQIILGDTWIAHHGNHGKEGTRGLNNGMMEGHPILKGVKDIWGYTDVYTVRNLGSDAEVLVYGQSSMGMTPDAPPNYDKSIMPVAWIKDYGSESGKKSRIFTTTMGASVDLKSEDLRRLLVNACYWAMDMEHLIPEKNNVEIFGDYAPTMFGFGAHKKGLKVSDFVLK
jgi:type 1 glutamine amidotransferase